MYKHSIVCCARWETAYIGEWIRYYDAIGFDRIYLYCNDDDPAEFAAEVERTPKSHPNLVALVHFIGQGQQRAMYLDAMRRVYKESLWVTFLDVDEFLFLPQCNSIQQYMSGWATSVDSIHFQWSNFGNSGFLTRSLGSVVANYTRRDMRLHQNTKHISRVSRLDPQKLEASRHPFWHGLFDPIWSNLRRVTVLGDDLVNLVTDYPIRLRAYLNDDRREVQIRDVGSINHYMIKSEQDFNIRVARGLGGDFSGQQIWQDQYLSGGYRNVLDSMNQIEDVRLRDLVCSSSWQGSIASNRITPGVSDKSDGGQPSGQQHRIQVRHPLWNAELILGSNGRARHSTQGTLASYTQSESQIEVIWDDWPKETFVREGNVFVVVNRLTNN